MKFCPNCGAGLEPAWLHCPKCSHEIGSEPPIVRAEIEQPLTNAASEPRPLMIVAIVFFLLAATMIISFATGSAQNNQEDVETEAGNFGSTSSEKGEATGRLIDFMGAKLTVTSVSRGNKATRQEERGDHLDIYFHLDNTAGEREIFLPLMHTQDIDDERFIGIVLNNGTIIPDFRSFFDAAYKSQYAEIYKIGEEGDFYRSFDLNPLQDSIKPNRNVRGPGDVSLVIGPAKKDNDRYLFDFFRKLSDFWPGPFEVREPL